MKKEDEKVRFLAIFIFKDERRSSEKDGQVFPTDQDGNIIEGTYKTPVGG